MAGPVFRRPVRRRPGSRRPGALLGVAVVAVLVPLSGCGGPDGGGAAGASTKASVSPASGPRNDVDVAFADTMIPHGVQALASTQLAAQKATTPQLKQVASAIGAAQVPQIETLSSWLVSWGQPVPEGPRTTSGGAAISTEDLRKLSDATGPAFEQLWLQTMIRHQQVALAVAQTEVSKGTNPGVKAMAATMLDVRKAQVATMQKLLTGQ